MMKLAQNAMKQPIKYFTTSTTLGQAIDSKLPRDSGKSRVTTNRVLSRSPALWVTDKNPAAGTCSQHAGAIGSTQPLHAGIFMPTPQGR